MKKLEKLRDMLCEELAEIAKKNELSAAEIELVDKLTHSVKSLDVIMKMEREEENGYSQKGYGEHDASYGNSYGNHRHYDDYDGYSGAKRRRDRMGRFASREDGKEHMLNQLVDIMDRADDPDVRERTRRLIMQIENA